MNGLVFSGGGARGAYQIGVWEALHEDGFEPDVVTGTSVGAILATLVAGHCDPDEMKQLWLKACQPAFMPYRKDVFRIHKWGNLRRNDKLADLLEEAIDWEAVRDSDVDLRFTAVDVCNSERALFDNRSAGPEALLASTAIPLVFPVETVDGRPLWDGGLLTSTPLQPAIESGAEEIFAVLNDPIQQPARAPPSNLVEVIERVIDIVNQRALRKDLRRAEEINELVRQGQAADYWHHIDFHLVAPEDKLEADALGFDEDEAREMWTCGYDDARAFLDGNHAEQEKLETFGRTPEWADPADEGGPTAD